MLMLWYAADAIPLPGQGSESIRKQKKAVLRCYFKAVKRRMWQGLNHPVLSSRPEHCSTSFYKLWCILVVLVWTQKPFL